MKTPSNSRPFSGTPEVPAETAFAEREAAGETPQTCPPECRIGFEQWILSGRPAPARRGAPKDSRSKG